MHPSLLRTCWGVALACACAAPQTAHALSHDLDLRGLGRPLSNSTSDPAFLRYWALTSEVMLSLMPRPMESAETLGQNGFEFSVGASSTAVHGDADFWRGQAGAPLLATSTAPGTLWTPVLHVRKGLPLSTEVGAFASFLGASHLAIIGGDVKIAIHESYIRWLPSLSLRAAVHRLLGATDFEAMAAEGGGLLSVPIALAGVGKLTPFAGYSFYFAQIDSQVIDETPFSVNDPSADQVGGPQGSLYAFDTIPWRSNFMWRAALGLRLQVAMVTLLWQVDIATYQHASGPLWGQAFKIAFEG